MKTNLKIEKSKERKKKTKRKNKQDLAKIIKLIMAKKMYAYEIYETLSGEKKIRSVSGKKLKEGDLDNIIFGKKSPRERKFMEHAYNVGSVGIGDKTGADEYWQTVEWGAEGGRPRIYENESEKTQAYRLRKKLKEGGELSNKQVEWLRSRGINVDKNNKLENVP